MYFGQFNKGMAGAQDPTATRRLQRLSLALLFLVALFNYIDRFVLGILLPSIKHDLALNDTQAGFIAGGAASLIYILAGIPIARLADSRSRRAVVAGAILVSGLMTAACGLAANFLQLAIARVLAGMGQAGVTGPATAVIGDMFPPKNRAVALSIYAQGLPAGILLGFFLGGVIVQQFDWRIALICCALPGVLLAPLLLRFLLPPLPEVHRLAALRGRRSAFVGIRSLAANRSFVHLCLGSGLFTVMWSSLLAWLPTFFLRSHGLPLDSIGLRLALVLGISQMIGLLAGGIVGDRLAGRDRRWYAWVCAAASLMAVLPLGIALSIANADTAMVLLFPAFMIGLMQGAPALAAVQSMAGNDERAMTVATYLLIVNVVSGLGTQGVGVLSDQWNRALGDQSLGYALLAVVVLSGIWSSAHFWLASRHLNSNLARSNEAMATASRQS